MVASLSQLRLSHRDYTANHEYWRLLQALSEGGSSVTDQIKKQLLVDANGHDCDRSKLAPYDCQIGSIIVKLTSQLMNTAMVPSGSDDKYWDSFFTRCAILPHDETGSMVSFKSLLANAALQALIQGRAIAQIDTSCIATDSIAVQKQSGGDIPYVILRNSWDLVDWSADRNGLEFAKLHTYSEERETWDSESVPTHKYTIYQTIAGEIVASVYNLVIKPDYRSMPFSLLEDEHVTITAEFENTDLFHTKKGRYLFPIQVMKFPKQLQLADQLFDLQRSYFNQNTSLEWSLLQTNYAMPVFTGIKDPYNEPTKPMGDGRFLEMGENQSAFWLEKSGTGNALTMDYLKGLKERMLEVIHTIANSVASTSGLNQQSGESKKEDRRNLDILLGWYGEQIKGFGQNILNVASIVRDEDVQWSIKGFDDYNGLDLDDSLDSYSRLMAEGGLDSNTLRRELQRNLVAKAGQLFDLSPAATKAIEDELADKPYNLDQAQRSGMIELAKGGVLSSRDLFELLIRSGDLPSDFDVDRAVQRLAIP
jgi:hypothetical protein